ncbi:GMC family oxidoreductase [Sciscionella marina]|uniref:GMC family oxidoreductase n=1 Tax=Sciscionella marina TaxID=508770 RepID=UPI000378386E|nr:GMC family oxidoreductase N-terminal domain-containing protein [Sciscionella marina]
MNGSENGSADVVVVGGGTSGCVLAARLSEDSGRSVLLLEEGPEDADYDPTVTRPEQAMRVSREQRFAEGLSLRVGAGSVPLARGRVLGGTSAINYLATVRGRPADYADWAARGNPGWSWTDVLPAFRKAEHDLDFPEAPWHGNSGPLTVQRWTADTFAPAHTAFHDGLAELGVPLVPDLNDPESASGIGVFPASRTPESGDRLTVSGAYLTPAVRARPNLRIRSGVRVARLCLRGRKTVGVQTEDGQRIHAGEVIVCCGAVGSPWLLQRSGLGPPHLLSEAGIEPVRALPGVGANLQDHLGPAVVYRTPTTVPMAGGPAQPVWITGVGTEPGTHVFPVPLPGQDGAFAVLVFSLRPCATGRVSLRTDDPQRRPIIELPAPGTEEVAEQQHAFDVLDAWENGAVAREFDIIRVGGGASLARPGAAAAAAGSGLASYAHLTGSCAMGPDPAEAVVDTQCRVHGLAGLRVVDASVMPTIPSGNTYLSCVMLAERVAEMMPAG